MKAVKDRFKIILTGWDERDYTAKFIDGPKAGFECRFDPFTGCAWDETLFNKAEEYVGTTLELDANTHIYCPLFLPQAEDIIGTTFTHSKL